MCRHAITKEVVQKQAAGLPVPVRCSPAVSKEPSFRLRGVFVLVLVLPRQKTTWRKRSYVRAKNYPSVLSLKMHVIELRYSEKLEFWFSLCKIQLKPLKCHWFSLYELKSFNLLLLIEHSTCKRIVCIKLHSVVSQTRQQLCLYLSRRGVVHSLKKVVQIETSANNEGGLNYSGNMNIKLFWR